MSKFFTLFILSLGIFTHSFSQKHSVPAPFSGKVVRILDGDTYEVLTPGKTLVRIRMMGIDAPEKNQAFGQRSKQTLGMLCGGQLVSVQPTGVDRYGRVLAYAYNSQGMNINAEMVRRGMAWHYKHYSKDPQLANAERFAQSNRIGIWSDPQIMAPWEFRKFRRNRK
ncbi:MAG: thermonuclease family protein [Chitinophagaceae bacterium]